MQKLYLVKYSGEEYYVLAFDFVDALKSWRNSKAAFNRADPDSLALVVPSMIGAAKKPSAQQPVDASANAEALGLVPTS